MNWSKKALDEQRTNDCPCVRNLGALASDNHFHPPTETERGWGRLEPKWHFVVPDLDLELMNCSTIGTGERSMRGDFRLKNLSKPKSKMLFISVK